MSTRLAIFITLALLASEIPTLAQDDPRAQKKCEPGHVLTPYNPPGYHFAVTSWMKAKNGAFVYTTCVENHDDKKSLFVDWLIPGPFRGYVAPNDSSTSPRPFVTRKSTNVTSCLVYGNSRRSLLAQYIGHEDDLPRAAHENNCAPQQARLISADAKGNPWVELDGRISVPSNLEDVDSTLIRFIYRIALVPSDETYKLVFPFKAAPVSPDTFKGKIQSITVRARAPQIRQAIEKTLGKKGGNIQLSNYTEHFEISMIRPAQYQLEQSRFGFFDVNGKLAAEIIAPYLSTK